MISAEDFVNIELSNVEFDDITILYYIETIISALNINIGCNDSDSDSDSDDENRTSKHIYKTYDDECTDNHKIVSERKPIKTTHMICPCCKSEFELIKPKHKYNRKHQKENLNNKYKH